MALDKLVDSSQLDADLTSVANAIRTKGGTSGQLAFPAGFVSAVQAIETGGAAPTLVTKTITGNGTYNASSDNADGYSSVTVNVQGGSGYTVDEIGAVDGISGDLVFNGRIKRQNAFYGCTGITSVVINSSDQGVASAVFMNCTNLVSATDNNTHEFGGDYFNGCTKLTTLVAPNLFHISARAFQRTKIRYLVLPNCGFIWKAGCGSCTSLIGADLGGYPNQAGTIEADAFNGATSMNILIWRFKTGVPQLKNISAFTNTPFASGKAGGTLYVPQDLIASYQAATNWSTILGYPNNKILPIEGSIYETQYVDGTAIPTT